MLDFIYWIGWIATVLLAGYLLLYIIKIFIHLDALPAISLDSMPAVKPVLIPTKNQNTKLQKIVASIFEVRKWVLTENWYYELSDGSMILIPKGFEFDGASIPRPLWALLSPTGLLLIPGLVHDYAYMYAQLWQVTSNKVVEPYGQDKNRKDWDKLFRSMGQEINGFSFVNFISWFALWLGGWLVWRGHRKANKTPTKPLL